MGGEDVAYFLQRAKGTYFMLSNPKIYEGDKIYPHHHSKFDVEESLFYKGMCAVLGTVFKYLSQKNGLSINDNPFCILKFIFYVSPIHSFLFATKM